ncbi:MAG: CsgG/HfaB family protein [Nevskiales bacterium]|nr:CsgG/HfaB family protein [Nevskiales bacterium]
MKRVLIAVLGAALLAACASDPQVTRGGGAGVEAVRALAPDARPRVAVAAVIDRTRADASLTQALIAANLRLPGDAYVGADEMLRGVRDMLTTELFASDRFIVLERDDLDAIVAEQIFSEAQATGETAQLPPSPGLEGADLLVVAALTAIDPGVDGAALPIPVPIGDDHGFGILHLRVARGYAAMDLRVIDVRTGRVLNATSVEGRHWRFGADFTGYFDIGHDILKVPGLFRLFRNKPLEQALQQMSIAAIDKIAEAAR